MLVAACLLLRIVVPAGFMPTRDDGRMIVGLCNGTGASTILVEIPGLDDGEHGQAQARCAFSDLAVPLLAGADAVQLADHIAFVLTIGITGTVAAPPRAITRLRPPLRGPPVAA